MSLGLYKDYFIEKATNAEVIESELGFILFARTQDIIYIHDIYIKPEYRKQHFGTNFVNNVIEKHQDAKFIACTVRMTKNPELSLISALKYGFKILSIDGINNKIELIKEL